MVLQTTDSQLKKCILPVIFSLQTLAEVKQRECTKKHLSPSKLSCLKYLLYRVYTQTTVKLVNLPERCENGVNVIEAQIRIQF